jgi:membrane protease YdiL (CAAX protease family)
MLLATQAMMLVVALAACRFAGGGIRGRLGLVPPSVDRVNAAVLVVATIFPFAAGLLAAAGVHAVFGAWTLDSPLMRMWEQGSKAGSVLWIITIAFAPGFVEEVLYRGLIQRALLKRWSPIGAIAVSSLLFALAHMEPGHAAFTFVIGIWFGVVAWRTGSVLLTFVMHAVINGSWTAIQMFAARTEITDGAWTWFAAIVVAVGIAAFFRGIRILRRSLPLTPRAAERPGLSRRVSRRAAIAALAGAALLYLIIPPGDAEPDRPRPPSLETLRDRAVEVVCPPDGEIEIALSHDAPVRIILPPNPTGVVEMTVAFDDRAGVIWLAYSGEITGKGADGIPRRGIIEQLAAGDPARLLIRFEDADERPVKAWVSFLVLEDRIQAALARAAGEDGWAIRGRRVRTGP